MRTVLRAPALRQRRRAEKLGSVLTRPPAPGIRRHRPALAAWLIVAIVSIAAGWSGPSLAQSPDRRSAWYPWQGWGGAVWADGPFIYAPWSPGPWPTPGYWSYPGQWYWYSPCYPFVSCGAYLHHRRWERGQARAEAQRSQADPGYPAAGARGLRFALPETELAPESELRPQYRDTGKIRPAFEHSGEYLPQLLERRGGPHQPPGSIEDRPR